MIRLIIVVTATLALSGCGAADFFFNKDIDLQPGHGQMSDIKQRGVFVQSRPDDKGVPSPVVCAEPSPDAMAAVAASLAASMTSKDGGSGSIASTVTESGHSSGYERRRFSCFATGSIGCARVT